MAVSRPRLVSRRPLIVAAIVSTPLFFAALLAATLAVEKATVVRQARRADGIFSVYDKPSAWGEAKIWLLALAVVAIVLAAGLVGSLFRHGVVLVGLAGIGVPLGLQIRLDRWAENHTERFPYGVDLIPDTIRDPLDPSLVIDNPSNLLLQGEWETVARTTVRELSWITVGFGAVVLLAVGVAWLRRRRALRRRPPQPAAPSPTTGAAPEVTRVADA